VPLVGFRAAKPPEAERFCPFSYKRGAKVKDLKEMI